MSDLEATVVAALRSKGYTVTPPETDDDDGGDDPIGGDDGGVPTSPGGPHH